MFICSTKAPTIIEHKDVIGSNSKNDENGYLMDSLIKSVLEYQLVDDIVERHTQHNYQDPVSCNEHGSHVEHEVPHNKKYCKYCPRLGFIT